VRVGGAIGETEIGTGDERLETRQFTERAHGLASAALDR
jgi:hypothetical protein